jgi:dTDP-4-dehydrorhamnose reductase
VAYVKEHSNMNALITGSDGVVGGYVDFGVRTNHRSLDVTDLKEVMGICSRYKPDTIMHLAAETNVERCDRDSAYAQLINGVGTYNVALAAREIGAKLVYISTSAVFDGVKDTPYNEQDVARPQSQYGHSKYLGELAVMGLVPESHVIARISWVFGGGPSKDQKFIAKILAQLDQPIINVVKGKRGSPTYAKDLVAGVRILLEEGKTGVYHMSNAGSPTRAEVAKEIVRLTGSKTKVREVEPDFFGNAYAHGVDNESMISRGAYMRPWQEALREYITTEWPQVMH